MTRPMIPKRLHYCWFGGSTMGPLLQRCMASWRAVLPDFKVVRWDESNLPNLPGLQELVRFRKWAQVANVVRLHALLEQGGVYFDTDVEAVHPLDELLVDMCFVGLEKDRPSHRPATNAIMAAEAGHPFIADNLAALLHTLTTRFKPFRGVTVLNIVLHDRYGLSGVDTQTLGNDRIGHVKVYARPVLHPPPPAEGEPPPPGAYTVHHCVKSWHRQHGLSQELASLRYKAHRLRVAAAARAGMGDTVPLDWPLPNRWPPRGDRRFAVDEAGSVRRRFAR